MRFFCDKLNSELGLNILLQLLQLGFLLLLSTKWGRAVKIKGKKKEEKKKKQPHTRRNGIAGTNLRTQYAHAPIYGRSWRGRAWWCPLHVLTHLLHTGDLLRQAGNDCKEPQVHQAVGHFKVHHLQDLTPIEAQTEGSQCNGSHGGQTPNEKPTL